MSISGSVVMSIKMYMQRMTPAIWLFSHHILNRIQGGGRNILKIITDPSFQSKQGLVK